MFGWQLGFPLVLKPLPKKLVVITPLVLLVSNPSLAQPLFVVPAKLNILAVAGAVIPKIIIIAQRDRVWASILSAEIQEMGLVWELGQHILLFLWSEDVPSQWVQENGLIIGVSSYERRKSVRIILTLKSAFTSGDFESVNTNGASHFLSWADLRAAGAA